MQHAPVQPGQVWTMIFVHFAYFTHTELDVKSRIVFSSFNYIIVLAEINSSNTDAGLQDSFENFGSIVDLKSETLLKKQR